MAHTIELPEGFTSRAPTRDDLDTVVALIRAHELADEGRAELTADDQMGNWGRTRFDLKKDAWLVHAASGEAAAYGEVWPRDGYTVILIDGYVHPEQTGKRLGRWLLRTMEARAREIAQEADDGERVIIHNTVNAASRAATDLLASEGYEVGRRFWRMLIEMDEQLPTRPFPEGVTVRNFREEDAADVHALVMAAFKDNAGHQHSPFEEWRGIMMDREAFDPALWWIVEADGRIVAVALCPKYEGTGWVRQFAVQREYRGKGIASALLRHVFREHYAMGMKKVGLVVDSYNRTGARAVYEGAGMHMETEYHAYEKEIRSAATTA